MNEQETAPQQQTTIVSMHKPAPPPVAKPGRRPVFGMCALVMFLAMAAAPLYLELARYLNLPRPNCTGESCLGLGIMIGLTITATGFLGACLNVVGLLRRERKPWYVIVGMMGNFSAAGWLLFLLSELLFAWLKTG